MRADKASGDDDDDGLTVAGIGQYIRFPVTIWRHRNEIKACNVPVPKEAPFDGRAPTQVALDLVSKICTSIPPIPDLIFLRAISLSIERMGRAEEVFGHAANLIGIRGLSTKQARRRYPLGRDKVSEAINALTNACVVVIQGLTGMRVSEICEISVNGVDPNTGLPDCIAVRPSPSGLDELFYLKSKLIKTVPQPVEMEWLVGIRPIGSDALPFPVQAACVLERLLRDVRRESGLALLVLGVKWSLEPHMPRPHGLNRALQAFFDSDDILRAHHPTTHQWRKTFAQYVIRSDSAMLPAIRDHFKHLSIAMTEQGYIAADPELRQIMDDAAVQNTVSIIGSMISGERRYKGPLADELRKTADRLGVSLGNRAEADKNADIEELVRSSGMRAWEVRFGDASGGHCMFRPGTGNCTEGCEVRWVLRAPLWSAARPDLCWECQNLVVDDTHLDFWKTRLEKQRAALIDAEANAEIALALLCRQRVAQCLVMLRKMGWEGGMGDAT